MKVYIENGCLNDVITGYEQEEGSFIFLTSASVFPAKVCLMDYESVDADYIENALFVQVQ